MRIRHPFGWWAQPGQRRAFAPLVVLTLLVMASLQVLGGPLKTEAAPMGIVSFEFAGEISKAQSIVASWGPKGPVYAGLNLGLDYLFIVSYASAIGLGCVLVGLSFSRRQAALVGWLGIGLGWGQWVAALLDATENYALIRVLLGSAEEYWPVVARWCAAPKFLLVAAGLVYILIGAALIVVRKTRA
jgi:hypothetical protein